MATLTTQQITRSGVGPTYAAAAAGGDKFTPTKDTFLHVKNGSGGALTVTIVTPQEAFPGAATADIAVSVPGTSERMVGPFPAQFFRDPADGLASITYSGVTTLTIAALQLAEA